MSPLYKRLPRELRHNIGKYLGLFVLLTMAISVVSGSLAAARSIQANVADARSHASVENFSFTTQFEASDDALDAVREVGDGCSVYKDYWSDVSIEGAGVEADSSARLFVNRDEVNKAIYFEGSAPQKDDQIALDKCFANSHGISVGDKITVAGQELSVTGIMVLSDYEALMVKNSDLAYNTHTFTVAQVTQGAFDRLAPSVNYRYSVILNDRDMSLVDRTSYEKDVAKALSEHGATVEDLVDWDSNKAATYADDDIQGDQGAYVTMSFLLVLISAFVFVVLTDAAIEQESTVIGTLLASGYRKGEIMRHYLAAPLVVGILGAVVGNVLGYTVVMRKVAFLYCRSYSVPPFQVVFQPWVFVWTTVLPLVLLVLITLLGALRKLNHTPLAFLRQEIASKSFRSSIVLPERWGFTTRFRTRVILRNASHFAILFVGIALSSLLLMFGLCFMPMIDHYVDQMRQISPAEHTYTLKAPLEIDVTGEEAASAESADRLMDCKDPQSELAPQELRDLLVSASAITNDPRVVAGHPLNTKVNSHETIDDAEKFCATSLTVPRLESDESEEVTVYGVEPHSKYWKVDVSGGKIAVGAGLAQKCGIEAGRQCTFTDKFTGDTYLLAPDDVVGNEADMNVYMSRSTYAEVFGTDPDWFCGYVSDKPLDLNERYVVSEVTPEQVSAVASQTSDSLGDSLSMMLWAAIPITITLIYLLTKTVIDRSARYISYMKAFGYRYGEIASLYVRPITVTVAASAMLSIPVVLLTVGRIMKVTMSQYAGNLAIWAPPSLLLEVVGIVMLTYLVVAAIHVIKIKRVSLVEAMKVKE